MPLPASALELSLHERIGQVLCFGWQESESSGDPFPEHASTLVEQMRVGGVVLLGRNTERPRRLQRTLAALQHLSRIPLLVAIDQEGGRVCRLRACIRPFPGSMALGATSGLAKDPARWREAAGLTYKQCLAQGRALQHIGINWNLAPVLDVNSNPRNPIIGTRSFGESAELVAHLGAAAVSGYRDAGILCCAKHFPGHGDTEVDSHYGLPVIQKSTQEMWLSDLVPYRALCAGPLLPAIMTTHIVFPAMDPLNPATTSEHILTGLLRQQLGYSGLIVTDCLEMDAIARGIGTAAGAVAALRAGADMVMVCHTLTTQRDVAAAIERAVSGGELPEHRLNEAVDRVLQAKRQISEPGAAPRSNAWRLESTICRRSATLLRLGTWRMPAPGGRLWIVGARACVDAACAGAVRACRRARVPVPPLRLVVREDTATAGTGELRDLGQGDSIVLIADGSTCRHLAEGRVEWLDRAAQAAHDRRAPVGVVLAGAPYGLGNVPDAGRVVCVYDSAALHHDAWLLALHTGRARGLPPVTIPER